MKRSFWQSLIAVVAGNILYLLVEPHPPPRGQHQLYRIDWGLGIDFWMRPARYGLLLIWKAE